MKYTFDGFVDVASGKMTLRELNLVISHYVLTRSPERLFIDIQRKSNGYHVTLWMSQKDFEGKL